MQILLTNDDGIHAPGLAAMESELRKFGDVFVVAPATEQSGVSQSITFLKPLVGHQVHLEGSLRGYAVEGTPADAVKLAIAEFCPQRPDLVVSGINGGLNAGINVLYSGTVGAALEGLFFGIDSVAVSLEWDDQPRYEQAAKKAIEVIRRIVEQKTETARLYNLNIPTQALDSEFGPKLVPMGTNRYGHQFIKRIDPKQRTYYWATNDPAPEPTDHETDLTVLADGYMSLTPLHYDLTHQPTLDQMQSWKWDS